MLVMLRRWIREYMAGYRGLASNAAGAGRRRRGAGGRGTGQPVPETRSAASSWYSTPPAIIDAISSSE